MKKYSYRLSYLYKSATTTSTADHMDAAITKITLEPSLSSLPALKAGRTQGHGENTLQRLALFVCLNEHGITYGRPFVWQYYTIGRTL